MRTKELTQAERIRVEELLIAKKNIEVSRLKREIAGHYGKIREIESERLNAYDNWEKSVVDVMKHTNNQL